MQDIDYLKKLQEAMAGEEPVRDEYVTDPSIRDEYVSIPEQDEEIARSIAGTIEETNQDAKDPNKQTKEEREAKEEAKEDIRDLRRYQDKFETEQLKKDADLIDPRAEYAQLIKDYRKRLEKKDEPNKMLDYLLSAGNIASVFQKNRGEKSYAIPDVSNQLFKQRQQQRQQDLSGLQNLQKMYQNYMNLGENGGMTPYQRKSLELQEKRIDALKGKEKRLTKKDLFQEEVKGRLSDKEVEGINALDDGMRILDEIEDIIKKTDIEEDLGPYSSRIEGASKYIPGMEQNPEFVKMQQLVGINLADYVKSISGAQVSEQEAQRLLKNIPNMTDNPGEFKTKLSTFRKELKSAKKDYLENIGKQKKGASKFLDQLEKDKKKSDAPHGETVERNGKMYKWNPIVKKYQLI